MGVFAGVEKNWAALTDIGRTHVATKGIVQSGLVLNLDAGVSSSYSGSGTSWTDLSGNGNTGTLTNGPTYSSANGGSIVFDGVDDYVNISSSSLWNFGLNDFTIDVWIYPTTYTSSTNNPTILAINPYYSANNNGFLCCLDSVGNLVLYTSTSYNGNVKAPLNTWTNCIFTRISGILKIYSQTVLGSSYNISTYNVTGNTSISIGYDTTFNSDPFTGKMSNIKIYNRALTASEISQNFQAMRYRFGI